MRDYIIEGTCLPVSQLSTEEIHDLLRCGVEVVDEDTTEEDVLERLRLELFIRERNLRSSL